VTSTWPEKGRDLDRLEFPPLVVQEAAPASPTETPAGPKLVASEGLGARLRAEPRLEGIIVEILPEGAEVKVLGEERVSNGRAWQRVVAPSGRQGWLDGTLLKELGPAPRTAAGATGISFRSLIPQATAEPAPTASSVTGSVSLRQVATTAVRFLGYPYRWGGASPAGFDCAGFVAYVYGSEGVRLPSSLGGQLASGRRVAADELRAGDLVFFANTYMPGLSHVGIYVGSGRFVHAADEAHGVVTSSLWDHYWAPRYYGASRPGRA
jgi:cell wall-associated NlpC family hydrolase